VDRNFSITLDKTEDVMKLENLQKKIQAFGFETSIIDGHNYSKILSKLKKFKIKKSGKPTCIICKTKKGKGSITLESDLKFHHSVPSEVEYKNILHDLGAEK
jgi:transketolase